MHQTRETRASCRRRDPGTDQRRQRLAPFDDQRPAFDEIWNGGGWIGVDPELVEAAEISWPQRRREWQRLEQLAGKADTDIDRRRRTLCSGGMQLRTLRGSPVSPKVDQPVQRPGVRSPRSSQSVAVVSLQSGRSLQRLNRSVQPADARLPCAQFKQLAGAHASITASQSQTSAGRSLPSSSKTHSRSINVPLAVSRAALTFIPRRTRESIGTTEVKRTRSKP